uniref:Uncharacterized protein n=1 Tax=Strigamia maritima TaxID=126957 RepID=T1JC83_STRMM
MKRMAGDVARQGCRPSLVNKKFLFSNSTSHEWMFGAIAEMPMASSSNGNESYIQKLMALPRRRLPVEMMGVGNKIISTERVVLKPKRRLLSSRRTSNQQDASTSTEPFQSELELQREDEIRKLGMELNSKQAVIADLEQRNESLRSEDIFVIGGTIKKKERQRHARLLNFVGRFLTRIWPILRMTLM